MSWTPPDDDSDEDEEVMLYQPDPVLMHLAWGYHHPREEVEALLAEA